MSQQFSLVGNKTYNNKKYECYYCDKLSTDDQDVYKKYGVLGHPGKPAYPSKADIEKYELEPQDKSWEM